MHTIKLMLIVLGFVVGNNLGAQQHPEIFQNVRYDIVFNEVSPDSNYLSFRKAYENSRDSLVVMQSRYPDTVFYQTAGVSKSFFTTSSTMFILKRNVLEILNLHNSTVIKHENISQIEYIPEQKIIAIITRNNEGHELLILDEKGQLVKKIPDISRIDIENHGNLFLIGENKTIFSLYQLINNNEVLIYTTKNQIQDVVAADATQLVLAVQAEDKASTELVYVIKKTKEVFTLKNRNLLQFFVKLTGKKGEVYVQAYVEEDSASRDQADIWYGNDLGIETKFYPKGERLTYFLWNAPLSKTLTLDSEKYPEMAYVGNQRFYIAFNPLALQDYSTPSAPLMLSRYDLQTKTYTLLGKMGSQVYFDSKGNWLISKVDKEWILFNLKSLSQSIISLPDAENVYFSSDSQRLYFEQSGKVIKYDIAQEKLTSIKTIDDFVPHLTEGKEIKLVPNYRLYQSVINDQLPLLAELTNPRTGAGALIIIKNEKSSYLIPETGNRISSIRYNRQDQIVSYVSENLNSPPGLFMGRGRNSKKVIQSNKQDTAIQNVKKEIFNYFDAENQAISGLLIYPMNFKPSQKYPMIVNIYETQSKYRNNYLKDGYSGHTAGFNIRHFIEEGYFVFLPDIVLSEKGPGLSTVDCLEKGLDALSTNANINFEKVGLIGHSHGGYGTNFTATHSKRFAAFVSGSGNSDLVKAYFSYNTGFNGPFYWQFEVGQYKMRKSFFDDRELYIKSSPIQFADKVTAPILLWTGKRDTNVNSEQTMEFYLALKRAKKKVVALFFEEEGHVIENPERKKELYVRISNWFAYYLKGEKTDWINRVEK